jgi:hypothetical protein
MGLAGVFHASASASSGSFDESGDAHLELKSLGTPYA